MHRLTWMWAQGQPLETKRFSPDVASRNRAYGHRMNWDLASLLHTTTGYPLIALICGLIVLEELGVPMPFAPGDFLLVLAGATIATTGVNPLVVMTATYASAVAGAMGGRELFERLGHLALPRIARFLHLGAHIDRLSGRLRRGGPVAVFVGRVTPGLRVVTNEVSGLAGLPRRTFLFGLAPAVAVYEGVFMGLGVWLGRSAWQIIEQHRPTPGQLALLVALLCASAVTGHVLVGLVQRSVQFRRSALKVLLLG
jgi:membrane protein DedA with SNARE-associated domain